MKFNDYLVDLFKYMSEKKLESEIWYEIRDNFRKWYINCFANDTIGMDMLIEYTKKVKKIENPNKDYCGDWEIIGL